MSANVPVAGGAYGGDHGDMNAAWVIMVIIMVIIIQLAKHSSCCLL